LGRGIDWRGTAKTQLILGHWSVRSIPIRLGKTIQHAYILSYDTYEFKNIPVGKYYCKYMWTDPVTGKRLFQKDNSLMEFKVDEYGGYVITLESTTNGNLTQSSIDENEFFD